MAMACWVALFLAAVLLCYREEESLGKDFLKHHHEACSDAEEKIQ